MKKGVPVVKTRMNFDVSRKTRQDCKVLAAYLGVPLYDLCEKILIDGIEKLASKHQIELK